MLGPLRKSPSSKFATKPIGTKPINPDEFPPAFWQAVAEFNQGQFYACHDTLEALWMEADPPLRNFYQGILQIAVACYHLGNQNQRGAMILLGEGMHRLRPYAPAYGSLELESFLAATAQLLVDLQTASPAQTWQLPQLTGITAAN